MDKKYIIATSRICDMQRFQSRHFQPSLRDICSDRHFLIHVTSVVIPGHYCLLSRLGRYLHGAATNALQTLFQVTQIAKGWTQTILKHGCEATPQSQTPASIDNQSREAQRSSVVGSGSSSSWVKNISCSRMSLWPSICKFTRSRTMLFTIKTWVSLLVLPTLV